MEEKAKGYTLKIILKNGITVKKDNILTHEWLDNILIIEDSCGGVTEIPTDNVLYTYS